MFVEERSLYAGQPVGVVVAEDRNTAICAATLVKVEYEDIQKPVLTIKDAIKAGRVKVAVNFVTSKTETSRQGDAEGVSRKSGCIQELQWTVRRIAAITVVQLPVCLYCVSFT